MAATPRLLGDREWPDRVSALSQDIIDIEADQLVHDGLPEPSVAVTKVERQQMPPDVWQLAVLEGADTQFRRCPGP